MISRHWHRRVLYAYFPPYRWWKNSSLYHRLMLWRWKRSMKRLEKQIGTKFIPAVERATAAFREWNYQYRRALTQPEAVTPHKEKAGS